jgi:hypothetical protein
VLNVGYDQAFWWGGQPRLCALLEAGASNNTLLDMTLNCTQLFHSNGLGTGNWLVALYMVRLAARFHNVDFEFTCSAFDYRTEILAWLQGCHPNDSNNTDWWTLFISKHDVSRERICDWDPAKVPLYLMAREIRLDMRKMARDILVDTETEDDKPPQQQQQVPSILDNKLKLDETVIHFRCGDILKLKNPRGDYGMIGWSAYKNTIDPNTTSIGIVTQPFKDKGLRSNDAGHGDACRNITIALQSYLHENFPKALVSIHNDATTETLPLAYARLMAAKQTLVGLSSFAAFPSLGAWGEVYFQPGKRQVNQWMNPLPELLTNLHAMASWNFIPNRRLRQMSTSDIITWLEAN